MTTSQHASHHQPSQDLADLLSALAAFSQDETVKVVGASGLGEALWPANIETDHREAPEEVDGEAEEDSLFAYPSPDDEPFFGSMPCEIRESDEWLVAIGAGFRKDTTRIDRKLQGKILEAINDLSTNPMKARGDTVKPLQGELKGCWRYRIDDFRLVYRPDHSLRQIQLIAFQARGSVYE